MVKQYQIDSAYYSGLREGFDPEVAEDLGIPMDPDTVEKQIASAKRVNSLIGRTGISQQVEIVDPSVQARQEAHEYYTQEFRLTGPRAPSTPQEKIIFNAGMTEVRAQPHIPKV
jgi:hypothetical protein